MFGIKIDPKPFEYHFFVSYTTREDEVKILLPHLRNFVKALYEHGYEGRLPLWWDQVNLGKFQGSDDQLRSALTGGLDQCISLLAFVSPGYLASEFCRFEWDYWMSTGGHPEGAYFAGHFLRAFIWRRLDPADFSDAGNSRLLILAGEHGGFFLDILDESSWEEAVRTTVKFLERCYERRMERWNALHGTEARPP
jgi:hypothetical protein